MKILPSIFDTIIPPLCILCGEYSRYNLCPGCIQKLSLNVHLIRDTNLSSLFFAGEVNEEKNIYPLQQTLSCYSFQDDSIKKIIHYYKYKNLPHLAKPLGSLLLHQLIKHLALKDDFILCPVPLHPRREQWRGYNQSSLLAQSVASQLRLPVINTITRTRDTPQQMKIKNRENRVLNVQDCFIWNHPQDTMISHNTNTPILIIDDVTTTLSTIQNLAKTLHNAGFQHIFALTLAH